ncbi:MAG: D-alanine--D-alanine ligase [Candidatus Paceibacterota bacterium]
MSKLRVGVLRGGPSDEYDVSLKTGANILKHLALKYRVYDIYVDKKGVWHHEGLPISPDMLFKRVDVVVNALHGFYGEDGKVQNILDYHKVPYTGSQALSSSIGMNKKLSKGIFKDSGIKTPMHLSLNAHDINDQKIREIFKSFPHPSIVKPVSSGSSVGVSVVYTIEELRQALLGALNFCDEIILEEFINGKEASCGVIDDFRGQKTYALMPIEVKKPTSSRFFDYGSKYSSGLQGICPSNFTNQEKRTIQDFAVRAHEALGLRHYSRSDFIVSPRRGIYILETNTLPELTEESLLSKSLGAVGCSIPDFFDHVIALALDGK